MAHGIVDEVLEAKVDWEVMVEMMTEIKVTKITGIRREGKELHKVDLSGGL